MPPWSPRSRGQPRFLLRPTQAGEGSSNKSCFLGPPSCRFLMVLLSEVRVGDAFDQPFCRPSYESGSHVLLHCFVPKPSPSVQNRSHTALPVPGLRGWGVTACMANNSEGPG